MPADDRVLDLMDRFTAALNGGDLDAVAALVTADIVFESTSPPPDGTRYQGREVVCRVWAQMLAATPAARFSVEEQFSAGPGRAVVRWRYDWAGGHVRGVDIVLAHPPDRHNPHHRTASAAARHDRPHPRGYRRSLACRYPCPASAGRVRASSSAGGRPP
jgi:ketosteroid isomerase-like protein